MKKVKTKYFSLLTTCHAKQWICDRMDKQPLFLWNLESKWKKITLKLLHKKTSNDYTRNYKRMLSVFERQKNAF